MEAKEILEAVAGAAMVLAFALMALLFLAATPDQCGAECELMQEECK